MTQNTKIFIALVSGFVVGFSLSKAMRHSTKQEAKKQETPAPIKQTESDSKTNEQVVEVNEENSLITSTYDKFPLQLGSEGEKVKRLQIFLMRNLGWVKQPDGKFDLTTQNRTLKFFKVKTINQELYEQFMLEKMVHDQRPKKTK